MKACSCIQVWPCK